MLWVCFGHSPRGFIWDLGGGFDYSLLVLCWVSLNLGHPSVGRGRSGTCVGLYTALEILFSNSFLKGFS